MEISAAISSFLTHVQVEKGLASNTLSAYRRDLAKFDAFAQKLESKTVARHLVTLRNFFRHAQVQDLISEDPSAHLESPKIRRSLPGYLRLEEVEKLLHLPDQKTALGL